MTDTVHHSAVDQVLGLGKLGCGWRTTAMEGAGVSIKRRIGHAHVYVTARDFTGPVSRVSMFVVIPTRKVAPFQSMSAMWAAWDEATTRRTYSWPAYGDGVVVPSPATINRYAEDLVHELDRFFVQPSRTLQDHSNFQWAGALGDEALAMWDAKVREIALETLDMMVDRSQQASDTGTSLDPAASTDLIYNNLFSNHSLQPGKWTRTYAVRRVQSILKKMAQEGIIKSARFGRRDICWERA